MILRRPCNETKEKMATGTAKIAQTRRTATTVETAMVAVATTTTTMTGRMGDQLATKGNVNRIIIRRPNAVVKTWRWNL